MHGTNGRRVTGRLAAAWLAALAVLLVNPVTAKAASGTKIDAVSLRISSEIEAGYDGGDVAVTTTSGRFSVENVEVTNEPSDEWKAGDKPKIKVTLEAADEYYFAAGFTRSDVNLIGNDGTVTSVSRTSSRMTVSITLEALEGSEYDLEVDGLEWDAANGTAYWNENEEAKKYEVRLYRGSTALTSVLTTASTSRSFAAYITKGGTYTFQVRGVYNSYNKGSWTESEPLHVTSAEAAQISVESGLSDRTDNEAAGNGTSDSKTSGNNTSGSAGPGDAITNGTWLEDGTGWWYCNADQSYTVNDWQYINGFWYFFNESGYMMTGWIDWNSKWYYCDESGAMLADTTTPDGYAVGSDGAWVHEVYGVVR